MATFESLEDVDFVDFECENELPLVKKNELSKGSCPNQKQPLTEKKTNSILDSNRYSLSVWPSDSKTFD